MKQIIIGIRSENAGFSVSFPNGFNGDPLVSLNDLTIDADGDDAVYGAITACANFLLDHVNELRSTQQRTIDMVDFTETTRSVKFIN